MKKILLALLVILVVPCSALASNTASEYKADWQYVFAQGNIRYYVDMGSPALENKTILSFWMKSEKVGKKETLYSHIAFDSKSKNIRCEEWYLYDSIHKKIVSSNKTPTQWKQVEQDSPALPILEYIIKHHPMFDKKSLQV